MPGAQNLGPIPARDPKELAREVSILFSDEFGVFLDELPKLITDFPQFCRAVEARGEVLDGLAQVRRA